MSKTLGQLVKEAIVKAIKEEIIIDTLSEKAHDDGLDLYVSWYEDGKLEISINNFEFNKNAPLEEIIQELEDEVNQHVK